VPVRLRKQRTVWSCAIFTVCARSAFLVSIYYLLL